MTSSDVKKPFDLQEAINNLQSLDPENIGSWPVGVKALIWVLTFVAILFVGYMLDISSISEELEVARQEEVAKKQDFESKAFKAANVDVYRNQLKDMEESFGALLRQLPTDTEVPGLLEDITHTGLGSGLEFKTIDLESERALDFYSELPIKVLVKGDYHSFGGFVSGIAALPRIVTLHDFKVAPVGVARREGDFGPPVLEMQITAKTYRYVDKAAGENK